MSKAAIVIMAIVCLLIAAAHAQTIWSPMVPTTNGPLGPGSGGAMYPNAGLPMVPNAASGGGPPPPTCSGATDFSDGCAIAVFPR